MRVSLVLAAPVRQAVDGHAPDKTPPSGTASPLLYVITAVGALVNAITLDWIIGLAHATTLAGER